MSNDLFFDMRQVLGNEKIHLIFRIKNELQGVSFSVRLIDGYFGEKNVDSNTILLKRGDVVFFHKLNPFGFNLFLNNKGGVVY